MMPAFTTASLKELFTFPFKDPRWKSKLLIAAGVNVAALFIPLLPKFFLMGYYRQIMQRIICGDGEPDLPEWQDWGRLFTDGFKLWAANIIYTFPALLLVSAGMVMMFIPLFLLPILRDGNSSGALSMFAALGALLGSLLMAIGTPISLVLGLAAAAALGHVVARGEFMAALRPAEWWPILRANLGGFILAQFITLATFTAVTMILQVLIYSIVLACLAPFLLIALSTWIQWICYTLYAQAYLGGMRKLAAQPAH